MGEISHQHYKNEIPRVFWISFFETKEKQFFNLLAFNVAK